MGYRRLFIMRKDLKMSPGKLAAQVGHCAEAYWTHFIRNHSKPTDCSGDYTMSASISCEIFDNYINGAFVKTICEARNKNQLLKAKAMAEELGLVEGEDFGLIYDNCLTELTPEEENGTTLTGIWFRPLPDETAHSISKKYHLYMSPHPHSCIRYISLSRGMNYITGGIQYHEFFGKGHCNLSEERAKAGRHLPF